jgi:hypothetical protein
VAASDDTSRRASFEFINGTTARVTLQDVALKSRSPQVMSIRRIQIFRRRIHNQEFIADRTLPRHSSDLSKECEVICHDQSMYLPAMKRNLR